MDVTVVWTQTEQFRYTFEVDDDTDLDEWVLDGSPYDLIGDLQPGDAHSIQYDVEVDDIREENR